MSEVAISQVTSTELTKINTFGWILLLTKSLLSIICSTLANLHQLNHSNKGFKQKLFIIIQSVINLPKIVFS